VLNSLKTLDQIKNDAGKAIEKVHDEKSLEQFRVTYIGRKSDLTKILRSIKNLPVSKKALVGKNANQLKKHLDQLITEKKNQVIVKKEVDQLTDFDISIPGKRQRIGHIHPITQIIWEIQDIFMRMGFEVFEAFDIDDDYHNFESLNMPKDHPARDIWDTFWTEDGFIPITQTSSMQNRIYRERKPPIRAIVIGHTFRNERTDARHEHTLHQCEGIYVDKGISFSDMIGTLKSFFDEIFHKDIQVQISPDYFPFVEPGNSMALSCVLCDMQGCRVCKYTGWLEILGCGMIHPNVLTYGGIDPNVYSGFAWGFGVERIFMLKHKVEDIRHFHNGDLRFINQF
jgi:phenylalanyl-tRNA synthetase alpha chain